MKASLSSMFQPAESNIPSMSPYQSHPVCHMPCNTSWMLWATAGREDASPTVTKGLCSSCAACRDYSLPAAALLTELVQNAKVKIQVLSTTPSFSSPHLVARELGSETYCNQNLESMSLLDLHPIASAAVRERTTL